VEKHIIFGKFISTSELISQYENEKCTSNEIYSLDLIIINKTILKCIGINNGYDENCLNIQHLEFVNISHCVRNNCTEFTPKIIVLNINLDNINKNKIYTCNAFNYKNNMKQYVASVSKTLQDLYPKYKERCNLHKKPLKLTYKINSEHNTVITCSYPHSLTYLYTCKKKYSIKYVHLYIKIYKKDNLIISNITNNVINPILLKEKLLINNIIFTYKFNVKTKNIETYINNNASVHHHIPNTYFKVKGNKFPNKNILEIHIDKTLFFQTIYMNDIYSISMESTCEYIVRNKFNYNSLNKIPSNIIYFTKSLNRVYQMFTLKTGFLKYTIDSMSKFKKNKFCYSNNNISNQNNISYLLRNIRNKINRTYTEYVFQYFIPFLCIILILTFIIVVIVICSTEEYRNINIKQKKLRK